MVVYEKSEKLRAEIFKNIGFVSASPFGIIILRLLADKSYSSENFYFNGFVVSIFLLALGYYFLDKSRGILEDLDKRSLE
ncbi:MAG: hypothetical protein HRT47_07845 [Candidatus Caenarcaniphilales bacterium]|nr:hypothetical protein [Candidatus Caenarcaniphilales bacterium]